MNEYSTSEKIKKFVSKKMLLGLTSMLTGLAIIFVCSIVPFAIDPSKWNTARFISDEMILVAITILGEVCLIMIAQSYNQSTDVSNLAKAKVKFMQKLDDCIGTNIVAFDQWVKLVLEKRDLDIKYQRLLSRVGIENFNYCNLSREQLKELLKHPEKIDNVYYRQLTKEQYHTIVGILNGKNTINFVDASTYRKLSKLDVDKTTSEKMANQQAKKSSVVASSIISKSMFVVCIGLVFGALVPTGAIEGTGEVLMRLFNRLFCFASAGFVGFFVGCQINDIDAEYILEKVDVVEKFYADKDFKPLTEQQLAQKEWRGYKTKEVQDGNKKVLLMNNSNKLEWKDQNEKENN